MRDVQRTSRKRTAFGCAVAAALVLVAAPAARGQDGASQNVEVDPVQCWWKTSTTAIRVGEPFTLHVTCSALETDAVTAVIDRARLATASVQFPPFEVTGGTQSADYVTPGRRFMQYHYTLRLITEDAFGSDVVIPPLPISYRIESRVEQDASLVGREQSYELPALVVRVHSLVPADARHIREAAVPTLDEIAARASRARLLRLLAIILFVLAGFMAALAAVRAVRQRRARDTAPAAQWLTPRAVLSGVRRELRAIQHQTRAGWDHDTVARTLAAARVVASYAAGQTVAQREVETTAGGEIAYVAGWLGRRKVAVSGAATAWLLQARGIPGELADALATLTAARYGRVDAYDSAALDEALASVLRAADRVAAEHTWLAETMRSIGRALRGWAPRAWAR